MNIGNLAPCPDTFLPDEYIAWFKLCEPLLADTIEECLVVLSQEKDTLSTLERISEARVARHGLPGLG